MVEQPQSPPVQPTETARPRVPSEVPTEFLPLYTPPTSHRLLAFIGFIILAVLAHAPTVARLGDAPAGGIDGAHYFERFVRGVSTWTAPSPFETGAYFPYGLSGLWTEPFLLPTLIAAPFVGAGIPPVVLFNLLILLATVATGYSAYRLAYQLTGDSPASFIGGAAFATSGFFGFGTSETPLIFAFFVPLATAAMLQLIARPSFQGGIFYGAIITASFYTSTDITTLAVISSLTLGAALLVVHPTRFGRRDYPIIVGGFIVGIAPIALVALPALGALSTRGFIGSAEILGASATLKDIVIPPHLGAPACGDATLLSRPFIAVGALLSVGALLAFGRLLETRILRTVGLVFLGTLVLAGMARSPEILPLGQRHLLALCGWAALFSGFVLLYRLGAVERRLGVSFVSNRALIGGVALAGSVAYLVSLGPVDTSVAGGPRFSIYAFLDGALGGFVPFHIPAHGALGVVWAASLLTAFSLVRLFRRLGSTGWLAPLIGLVIIVENHIGCPPPENKAPVGSIFSRLTETSPGDVVVVLPLLEGPPKTSLAARREARRSSSVVLTALAPPRVTSVNGAGLIEPPYFSEIARKMADFPSTESIEALARLPGIRFIIVRTGAGRVESHTLMARAARHPDAVRYIDADEAGNFLFEFIATTRVEADYSMLGPTSRAGIVTFELMAPRTKEAATTLVKVLRGHTSSSVITEMPLRADGQWHHVSLPLLRTHRSGAPESIRFEVTDRSTVSLRRPRFVPSDR